MNNKEFKHNKRVVSSVDLVLIADADAAKSKLKKLNELLDKKKKKDLKSKHVIEVERK